MESFRSHAAVARRARRYLVACLVTVTALACASDDSDESGEGTTESSAEAADASMPSSKTTDKDKKQPDTDKSKSESSSSSDDDMKDRDPDKDKEADKETPDDPNPGMADVIRYDGVWSGMTSQGEAISFKILNRFLVHATLDYTLEGDADSDAGSCDAETETVEVSAMTPMRGGAFTLMQSRQDLGLDLRITIQFQSDTSAEGEFTVRPQSDVPDSCADSVSGTWTATH